MSAFDESPDPPSGPRPDHDVLLVAGSRPEVARLAPVATACAAADRIRAITVATGPDPMSVHEAFDAFDVPADVTLLLREPPGPSPADVAAALIPRLDALLVDLDPSAVMVQGGGIAAAMAAQVAFWREVPVVHLQAGAADGVPCPFPQGANRRVIGQVASLILTGSGTLMAPEGPSAIPVGDTMAANPPLADLDLARVAQRVRRGLSRLVLVGLDRPDSLGVLASLPHLLEREADIEIVVFGELATHGAAHPLAQHARAVAARDVSPATLLRLIAASTVLVCDDPGLVADAPALGTPAVLVDGPHIPEPGDSIRSILSPAVLETLHQVLAAGRAPASPHSDGLEAARAEQAVAWMFGLSPTPLLDQARETAAEESAG